MVLSVVQILSRSQTSSASQEIMVNASCLTCRHKHMIHRGTWVLAIDDFDFAFAENGLTAYRLGKPLPSQSFIKFVGEERYKKLANFILHYIADLDIPIKRHDHTHSFVWCQL